MSHRLVFATRNPGKLFELRELLQDVPVAVLAIDELGFEVPEVVEDGDTFLANARKKALEVSAATGLPALADDSGLEVDALAGAPGVYSARYAVSADEAADLSRAEIDERNNDRLLAELARVPDDRRTARFRSVLAFADCRGALGHEVISASGICEGQILATRRGNDGFGYDPIFYSPELGATFAEVGIGRKNDLSHRARAMKTIKPQLESYFRLANSGTSG